MSTKALYLKMAEDTAEEAVHMASLTSPDPDLDKAILEAASSMLDVAVAMRKYADTLEDDNP